MTTLRHRKACRNGAGGEGTARPHHPAGSPAGTAVVPRRTYRTGFTIGVLPARLAFCYAAGFAQHRDPNESEHPMYEEFYGLRTNPFTLLPAPEFLYESRKHALGVSLLEYAVERRLLLSMITGEVGSGKTTIVRRLLNNLGGDVTVGLISNTHAGFGNLMQWVALAFDLPFKDRDKVELYHDFVEFLVDQYRQGRRTLLIVDEAQNLDVETLEELRLLTNVNADDHHVLQTLLVGQPELHDKLKRHELRQLAQRISVSHRVEPLDETETAEYVRHRLRVAGGDPRIFHKNALRLIHRNSGGIPRIINTLCDQALVYGYADGKRQIDALLIADIARDRIDTGLYGEVVHDLSSLAEHACDAPEARAAGAAPAAAGGGSGPDETHEVGAEALALERARDGVLDFDLTLPPAGPEAVPPAGAEEDGDAPDRPTATPGGVAAEAAADQSEPAGPERAKRNRRSRRARKNRRR